jgi:hypothetical protein
MMCHEIKWSRDIHAKPRDYVATLIAKDSEFPEIVGSKQRYYKQNNVCVWLEWLKVFFEGDGH